MTGTETRYQITVKTGDKRFAGTDANVFIQLAGVKGITKKLKLDDAKNNFERNMVDSFEVRYLNGLLSTFSLASDVRDKLEWLKEKYWYKDGMNH